VADVVGERLPRTVLLALVCHLFASVLGIGVGIWAATRQYSGIDSLLSGIAFLGRTVPSFLRAMVSVGFRGFQLNGY
ncbi:ABC transporter permease, partial [Rhizobium leguminosarum]